eukprot:11742866-Ditylum_brightwellii.AAC.1
MHSHKKPSSPKDIFAKEEILHSKGGGGLSLDGEVRALMCLPEKPSSPKDISSEEEILQSKGSGLSFDE